MSVSVELMDDRNIGTIGMLYGLFRMMRRNFFWTRCILFIHVLAAAAYIWSPYVIIGLMHIL